MSSIDLNADVGESYGRWQLGDDARLIPHLSSANVACGFHAGDALTLQRTVALCAASNVAIGAQVSYHDLAGFGRRAIDIDAPALAADVLYQIGALDALARAAGSSVTYVKPHGALYHRCLTDTAQAQAVIDAVVAFGRLPVMTMSEGALADAARTASLTVIREGFADRGYGPDGRLIPRGQPGDLLVDSLSVAEQSVRLARSGTIDSLCLHGDTPGASDHAAAVRAALAEAGIQVRSAHGTH